MATKVRKKNESSKKNTRKIKKTGSYYCIIQKKIAIFAQDKIIENTKP